MESNIVELLEDVEFIGVQEGFGNIPSFDLINCKKTGTTFALAEGESLTKKLFLVRKKFLDNETTL